MNKSKLSVLKQIYHDARIVIEAYDTLAGRIEYEKSEPNASWAKLAVTMQTKQLSDHEQQLDALIEQYQSERRGSLPVGPDEETTTTAAP